MQTLDNTLKAYTIFLHRCRALQQDGYALVCKYQGETLWFHKYHHSNGNTIVLKLFPRELRIVQLTNGRETHTDTLREP